MYVTAQNGVYALDAQTGAQLWKFESDGGTRRGVTYWPGDDKTPARIFGSAQERLVALDAKSGRLVPQFGQGGFVDMGTTMASPASLYKDILITPATSPVIRAWNARTGALIWKFDLVAQPGDPNNKTWEGESWKAVGGTNTWGYLTVDTERGIVYVPTSIAGENDYVGVTRPGDNLYGTALVALDIATGKRLWHQQLVHHDIWDNDLGAHPTLIDVTRNGKTVPAVAQITKMGLLFIFNRVTGEPMFGMEERPVPQSTVPGEKTVADAAVPAEAAAAGAQLDQAIGAADEHFAGAHGLLPGAVGEVQPPGLGAVHAVEDEPGRRRVPGRDRRRQLGRRRVQQEAEPRDHQRDERGAVGTPREERRARRSAAINQAWAAAAVAAAAAGAGGGPPRSREPYRKVTPEGGRFWDPKTQYSCAPTPWGELIAVNANTGDIAWRVPLGELRRARAEGHQDRAAEPRRRHHHRRQSRVHRRDHRRHLPRVRRAQRQASCGRRSSTVPGALDSVHLHGQGRQAVRGDPGRRRRIPAQPDGDAVVAFRLP